MTRAFVVMTALPPTKGHLDLIGFAKGVADNVTVMLNTQPGEPFVAERVYALQEAMVRIGCHISRGADEFRWMNATIEQDPEASGFWDMWRRFMDDAGCTGRDATVVASEPYGRSLAALTGVRFMPYDLDRSVRPIKATPVREDPYGRFADMIPEFQRCMRLRVTIFGAESTGKTTLARSLAETLSMGGVFGTPTRWLFEWARPYLENTANVIDVRSMTDIWEGQAALQAQADGFDDTAVVVQDTDLYSTVGYWEFPHWDTLGDPPRDLVADAWDLRSDLYLMTRSNIPFESDPLRYGGDVREGSDEYWEQVLIDHGLPYVVLDATDHYDRVTEALGHIRTLMRQRAALLAYDRGGL